MGRPGPPRGLGGGRGHSRQERVVMRRSDGMMRDLDRSWEWVGQHDHQSQPWPS